MKILAQTKWRSCWLLCGLTLLAAAQPLPYQSRYPTSEEVQPLLRLMNEILPAPLKDQSPAQQAALWPGWIKNHDEAVRARLRQGDEDTLVNFLLFGVSFTRQPRVTVQELSQQQEGGAQIAPSKLIQARIDDLVRALRDPKQTDERLVFARALVTGRADVREYLAASLLRVLKEQESLAQTLQAARAAGNASEEFAERSRLYRTRGLSLDTMLAPNFALEESLKQMKARGLLTSVTRVAVIGPGLDFTDKTGGYDFYPPQTIQPFAVLDTLLRLGLARANEVQVTAFDLSPRVLEHLARARQQAARGRGYTVQLPHDPAVNWTPAFLNYRAAFGDRIGAPISPLTVPAELKGLKLRAVRIAPAMVARVIPAELNIVAQRLAQPQNFDLLIATNILVYYDLFEQSLALANLESMLRPGGFLLSNNALLELPVLRMRSVDYLTVSYSDRADDGDHIVWYQREK